MVELTVTNTAPDLQADKTVTVEQDSTDNPLNIVAPTDMEDNDLTITVTAVPNAEKGTVKSDENTIKVSDELTDDELVALTFDTVADENGVAGDFVYQVSDDDPNTAASTQTVTLEITPVNDAPEITIPNAQETAEDETLIFSSEQENTIVFTDRDLGDGELEVTLEVAHGTLSLALPESPEDSGLTFKQGSGINDAKMVFSGSIEDVNAAVDGLIYLGESDYNGEDVLYAMVNDQGSTGSDGAKTAEANVAITVTPVNDPPTLENPILNQDAVEDIAFSFTFDADTFDDIDSDTIEYNARLDNDSNLPEWLSFDQAERTFSGTPAHQEIGTISVKVIANDGSGGTENDIFNITVNDSIYALNKLLVDWEDTPENRDEVERILTDSDLGIEGFQLDLLDFYISEILKEISEDGIIQDSAILQDIITAVNEGFKTLIIDAYNG